MLTDKYDIHNLPFYKGLSHETRVALHGIARMQRLHTGAVLVREGDITNAFYSMVSGGMRLIESVEDGKQVNLKVYGPGDIFGLLSMAGQFSHRADVVAADYSEVLEFNAMKTRKLSHEYPEIALRIIDLLVLHVEHAHTRIRTLAGEKVERRLARSLLHFCQKFGSVIGETLSANFSQQDIAEFTGTTVETVNRTFKKWENQNLIQRSRMSVAVIDAAGLRKIADNEGEPGMGYYVE